MNLQRIFQNDDTGAFRSENEHFLKINRPRGLADDVVITKLELKCGNLPIMAFGDGTEPLTFPIGIDLTASQTKSLSRLIVVILSATTLMDSAKLARAQYNL